MAYTLENGGYNAKIVEYKENAVVVFYLEELGLFEFKMMNVDNMKESMPVGTTGEAVVLDNQIISFKM
jgi:hypothetical protein